MINADPSKILFLIKLELSINVLLIKFVPNSKLDFMILPVFLISLPVFLISLPTLINSDVSTLPIFLKSLLIVLPITFSSFWVLNLIDSPTLVISVFILLDDKFIKSKLWSFVLLISSKILFFISFDWLLILSTTVFLVNSNSLFALLAISFDWFFITFNELLTSVFAEIAKLFSSLWVLFTTSVLTLFAAVSISDFVELIIVIPYPEISFLLLFANVFISDCVLLKVDITLSLTILDELLISNIVLLYVFVSSSLTFDCITLE